MNKRLKKKRITPNFEVNQKHVITCMARVKKKTNKTKQKINKTKK
jgi:hypothetical protein